MPSGPEPCRRTRATRQPVRFTAPRHGLSDCGAASAPRPPEHALSRARSNDALASRKGLAEFSPAGLSAKLSRAACSSAKFQADAVALARSSGRPVSRIATELGVNHETPRQWIKTAEKAGRPESVAASAKDAEIAALRRQAIATPRSSGVTLIDGW
ncbi:transposase [Streptomyces misionensis]|uniref:Transposase n=1 Tax=Streptomyces misionensis TaxID=67331 RepID=A0A5C6JZQ5_9ACTN|nr:transposase [Streptomyces misionensis]TWV55564.1 transposase [Streptomyces misionensis]